MCCLNLPPASGPTFWLGLWGAALSPVLAVIRLREFFTVTNVGRRKLRVMGFGVRMRWHWKHPRARSREMRSHQGTDFPRDLGEGETMEFDDPMYQAQLKLERTGGAFVYDSLGGCWELPRRHLRLARQPELELPREVLQRPPRKGS